MHKHALDKIPENESITYYNPLTIPDGITHLCSGLTIMSLLHALKFLFLVLLLLMVPVVRRGGRLRPRRRRAGHHDRVGQLLHRLPLGPPRRRVLQRWNDLERVRRAESGCGNRLAGRFKMAQPLCL